jgi:hypothetical protein
MKAYKTYLTIQDPKHVALSNVPFHPGQRVEVILLAAEDDQSTHSTYIRELKRLFKATQELPQAQSMTEEDIAAEIKAYRCSCPQIPQGTSENEN